MGFWHKTLLDIKDKLEKGDIKSASKIIQEHEYDAFWNVPRNVQKNFQDLTIAIDGYKSQIKKAKEAIEKNEVETALKYVDEAENFYYSIKDAIKEITKEAIKLE